MLPHFPRAEEWPLDVQLVDGPHQGQVLRRLAMGLVVPAAPWQADQLALTGNTQVLVVRFDTSSLGLS
jgi:hypothetical protein